MTDLRYINLVKNLKVSDLYSAFKDEKTIKDMKKVRNSDRYYRQLRSVFKAFLELVIDDIIENNISFKMPTVKRESYLELRYVDSEEFKHFRFRNMYPDGDPLRMNFHCVEMVLRYYDKRDCTWKFNSVLLSKKYRDRILQNIYNGKY